MEHPPFEDVFPIQNGDIPACFFVILPGCSSLFQAFPRVKEKVGWLTHDLFGKMNLGGWAPSGWFSG